MTLALQIILVLTSVLMTVFVLLHKGKGGGLSSLFGGGVQSNLSGSTIVEKNLDRYTILMAIIWITCIVALNLIQAYGA
ncbi:preprotein translocase subunit SecG [Corynebacterium comes]|uniref:Protein-export membrane protein SecG n=1 Tax=Corynebacterium comes TaxID=2675218 RepID=A0A6B8VH93_9CORY|nr:preprotein translocase subunit SecG [Corynebacterium comes]QGU04662.1 preprotein translocase subunit SecG [Corynebacterium comes]